MNRHAIAPLPAQAEALQGKPAGIVSRGLAAAVDVLVVVSATLIGYLAFCGALFAMRPRSYTTPDLSPWIAGLSLQVLAAAYLTLSWWIAGRTYGCAVLGLRVVDRNLRDLRFVRSLVRALICVVLPIGLLWCALDSRARALHDLVTGSRVLYDWRHQEH